MNTSTEMRDTARLVNGRIRYDRAVIMARAWKRARREFDAFQAMGKAAQFPLRQLFAESLKHAWADAKAVAWRLSPQPLSREHALRLEILNVHAAERPSATELRRLAAAEHELDALRTTA